MMTNDVIIRSKRELVCMENLAENTYIPSGFAWLYDPENEVSDEENEEILRTFENLSENDLRIARSEIIYL